MRRTPSSSPATGRASETRRRVIDKREGGLIFKAALFFLCMKEVLLTSIEVTRVLGSRLDPDLAERLHDIGHHGTVRHVELATADTARRRLRATASDGTEVLIALSREDRLFDGAVLELSPASATIVRVKGERWLVLEPASAADALELGYHAGNLHWRVRFEVGRLLVALEAPAGDYLARLGELVARLKHEVREGEA